MNSEDSSSSGQKVTGILQKVKSFSRSSSTTDIEVPSCSTPFEESKSSYESHENQFENYENFEELATECPVERYIQQGNFFEVDDYRDEDFVFQEDGDIALSSGTLNSKQNHLEIELYSPVSQFSGKRIFFDRTAQHHDSSNIKRVLGVEDSDSRFLEASNSGVQSSALETDPRSPTKKTVSTAERKKQRQMTRQMSLLEKKKKQWEEERGKYYFFVLFLVLHLNEKGTSI